mgnify:FL=1
MHAEPRARIPKVREEPGPRHVYGSVDDVPGEPRAVMGMRHHGPAVWQHRGGEDALREVRVAHVSLALEHVEQDGARGLLGAKGQQHR